MRDMRTDSLTIREEAIFQMRSRVAIERSLRLGEIYYGRPTGGGHHFCISINGYLAKSVSTPVGHEVLVAAEATGPAAMFHELSRGKAMKITWGTKFKLGATSQVFAGFLLPAADCQMLLNMVEGDPNALQALIATLFPDYHLIYPGLILGRIEITRPRVGKATAPVRPLIRSYSDFQAGVTGTSSSNILTYTPAASVTPVELF